MNFLSNLANHIVIKLKFIWFCLLGLAYVGTMCKIASGKSASIVQDVGNFQSASVIAHELGHR